MSLETIPHAVLEKHPELVQIFEALATSHQGHQITARCPKCDHILSVTDLPDIGALSVTCEVGCTSYRESYTPNPTSK